MNRGSLAPTLNMETSNDLALFGLLLMEEIYKKLLTLTHYCRGLIENIYNNVYVKVPLTVDIVFNALNTRKVLKKLSWFMLGDIVI